MSAIVYLHGFRSSPASIKARQLEAAVAALSPAHRPRLHIPALTPEPREAVAQVAAWVDDNIGLDSLTFVGSSLGGFYATWLAERFNLRAVLVNPAVRPYDLLAGEVGRQTNFHTGEEYDFTLAHVAELRELEVDAIDPQRYLLMVETGDEVLDYRHAVEKYRGAQQLVIKGGDHGFSDFADYLDEVMEFCVAPAG